MTDNLHLEQQTQDIAKTISGKKESWISLGIRELMAAIRGGSEKKQKRSYSHDDHQISEESVVYQNKRSKIRPPITPAA